MKKDEVINILDNVVESDFAETKICSVPMIVPTTPNVPDTIQEEQIIVKKNLYDTDTKLRAVLDFLVNNIEELTMSSGLIKQSPVQEICSVAREIANINDKIYRYSSDNKTDPIDKAKTLNVNQTNYNFNSTDKKEGFSIDDLDNQLKSDKILKV